MFMIHEINLAWHMLCGKSVCNGCISHHNICMFSMSDINYHSQVKYLLWTMAGCLWCCLKLTKTPKFMVWLYSFVTWLVYAQLDGAPPKINMQQKYLQFDWPGFASFKGSKYTEIYWQIMLSVWNAEAVSMAFLENEIFVCFIVDCLSKIN